MLRRSAAVLLLGAVGASCTATARVSDVYTALDGNGDRPRSLFFTDSKEIHCVVEAGIGRKGVTIEAIVRQLEGYDFVNDRTFGTDRVTANVEASPAPGDGIQKTDVDVKPLGPDGSDMPGAPFPRGHFRCEAYLDGSLQQSALFDIAFPECPAATIKPASLCIGFYKQGTGCPRFGATSTDPKKCRCSPSNGWECDP